MAKTHLLNGHRTRVWYSPCSYDWAPGVGGNWSTPRPGRCSASHTGVNYETLTPSGPGAATGRRPCLEQAQLGTPAATMRRSRPVGHGRRRPSGDAPAPQPGSNEVAQLRDTAATRQPRDPAATHPLAATRQRHGGESAATRQRPGGHPSATRPRAATQRRPRSVRRRLAPARRRRLAPVQRPSGAPVATRPRSATQRRPGSVRRLGGDPAATRQRLATAQRPGGVRRLGGNSVATWFRARQAGRPLDTAATWRRLCGELVVATRCGRGSHGRHERGMKSPSVIYDSAIAGSAAPIGGKGPHCTALALNRHGQRPDSSQSLTEGLHSHRGEIWMQSGRLSCEKGLARHVLAC